MRFGGAFVLLVFELLPYTPKVNLLIMCREIKVFYKENNTKHRYKTINKLTTMFKKKKGYAKMRGKAVEILGLGPALLKVWAKYMNKELEEHRIIRLRLSLSTGVEKYFTSIYQMMGSWLCLKKQLMNLYRKLSLLCS